MPKSLAMIDFRYMIFSNTSGHNIWQKKFNKDFNIVYVQKNFFVSSKAPTV